MLFGGLRSIGGQDQGPRNSTADLDCTLKYRVTDNG